MFVFRPAACAADAGLFFDDFENLFDSAQEGCLHTAERILRAGMFQLFVFLQRIRHGQDDAFAVLLDDPPDVVCRAFYSVPETRPIDHGYFYQYQVFHIGSHCIYLSMVYAACFFLLQVPQRPCTC